MQKIRVLVVDETTLMRQGIRSLLAPNERIEFVGDASNAVEAADLVSSLAPDVMLLDQDVPGLDCAEAIKLIKARHPKTEIIVLAQATRSDRAVSLLEAGASGYVLKDINPENLGRAIEGVCDGTTPTHPHVTRQLVERLRLLVRDQNGHNGKGGGNGVHVGGLTSRELGIVLEMTKGATDKEIADRMYVSITTIKSHIRSILRKIGARNRTQAVVYVLRNGLVQ